MGHTYVAGRIPGLSARAPIDVPRAAFILGSAGLGTYVGFRLGGPHGAAAGALVATVVSSMAVLVIRRLRVRVTPGGVLEVEIEWAI